MLKELLKNREFLKIINKSLKKQEIIDILLIGSAVRGKENPNDIDLIVIYIEKTKDIIELNYALKKDLSRISKDFEIIGKRYSELFKPVFIAREAILSESYSFRTKKPFSEGLGYANFVLFRYSLKKMSKSKKMQFYYALHGRGKREGILKKSNGYKFSEGIILCPVENSEFLKEFFEKWHLKYLDFPALIPNRIVGYKLEA